MITVTLRWHSGVKNQEVLTFKVKFLCLKNVRIFLNFFSLKNINSEAHFLIPSIFKSLYFLKWCPIFECLPLLQFSIISFNYSWFLAKNLFSFVSLPWKLHHRYCLTFHGGNKSNRHLRSVITWSSFVLLKFNLIHSK